MQPKEFTRESQMFLWLDSMSESFKKFKNKVDRLESMDNLDHEEALYIIRDQYRMIEILYNIETGKTSVHGTFHPKKDKK